MPIYPFPSTQLPNSSHHLPYKVYLYNKSLSLPKEMELWLNEYTEGWSYFVGVDNDDMVSVYNFISESDAVAFKLCWS